MARGGRGSRRCDARDPLFRPPRRQRNLYPAEQQRRARRRRRRDRHPHPRIASAGNRARQLPAPGDIRLDRHLSTNAFALIFILRRRRPRRAASGVCGRRGCDEGLAAARARPAAPPTVRSCHPARSASRPVACDVAETCNGVQGRVPPTAGSPTATATRSRRPRSVHQRRRRAGFPLAAEVEGAAGEDQRRRDAG